MTQRYSRQQPAGPSTFRGQQPGETVVLLAREHWLVLTTKAWPVLLTLVLLLLLVIGQATSRAQQSFWNAGEVLTGVVTLGLLARWAITDAAPWWYHLAIVTNQRVISSTGIFKQAMSEISLGDVQAIRTESQTIDEWLFGYGRVTIAAAGGKALTFRAIAAPQQVAVLISTTRDTHAPAVPTTEPLIVDPVLRQMLDGLGQSEPLPTLAVLPSACTRQWPLSRALNVTLNPGETTLGIVSRHWWALVRPALPPLVLLATALLVLLGTGWLRATALLPVALGGVAIGLVWFLIIYLNFADDVFIFTTQRIIDVQRRYFILYEVAIAIEYAKIQAIETSSPSLWAKLLHYGTVRINAAGYDNAMTLDLVPEPRLIEQAVARNRTTLATTAAVATTNREKVEIKDWFAAVVGELVIIAPELRGLTLEAAMVTAQQTGLRAIVTGESYVITGVPAGTVISQSPMPGARALRGGDVALVLSRMW